MLKSPFLIVYYNNETIFSRAESFGVLLCFYAQKEEESHGKNINCDFRSNCGSN